MEMIGGSVGGVAVNTDCGFSVGVSCEVIG